MPGEEGTTTYLERDINRLRQTHQFRHRNPEIVQDTPQPGDDVQDVYLGGAVGLKGVSDGQRVVVGKLGGRRARGPGRGKGVEDVDALGEGGDDVDEAGDDGLASSASTWLATVVRGTGPGQDQCHTAMAQRRRVGGARLAH